MARSLFPYDAPREGQARFLRDAREWLGRQGILLAQAPTGLGKTAVALAASLEVAREEGKRVIFTTARRSQHRIAVETVGLIGRHGKAIPAVDLVAQEAMCPDHGTHPREGGVVRPFSRTLLRSPLHAQDAVRLARRFGVCPYRAALRAAKHAELIVCDYNHFFDPAADGVIRSLGIRCRDLICIVDEAHNLPSRARGALSHGFAAQALARLARVTRKRRDVSGLAAVSRLLATEAHFVGGDSRIPVDFLDRLLERCPPFSRSRDPRGALLRRLDRLAPQYREDRIRVREARAFLEGWEREDHLRLLSRGGGGSLLLMALDPQPATREVFRRFHAALLMSGTLHPGEMYVNLLGLEARRTKVREYRSDFPSRNRLLLATRGLSLSYRKRPGAFRPCAREIARLCHEIPGNVAAFFPSYEVGRRIGEALRAFPLAKRLVWERRGQTKAAKESLIRVLRARQRAGGCLLMAVQAGSLSEGIDYPGNLLQGVIVAGLAMSPPDLRVEALRAFYASRFGRRRGYEYAYLYP
ncbi:MAG: ATP-dependent DNA helicase, partial [Thermoplasmata archaeon]